MTSKTSIVVLEQPHSILGGDAGDFSESSISEAAIAPIYGHSPPTNGHLARGQTNGEGVLRGPAGGGHAHTRHGRGPLAGPVVEEDAALCLSALAWRHGATLDGDRVSFTRALRANKPLTLRGTQVTLANRALVVWSLRGVPLHRMIAQTTESLIQERRLARGPERQQMDRVLRTLLWTELLWAVQGLRSLSI